MLLYKVAERLTSGNGLDEHTGIGHLLVENIPQTVLDTLVN